MSALYSLKQAVHFSRTRIKAHLQLCVPHHDAGQQVEERRVCMVAEVIAVLIGRLDVVVEEARHAVGPEVNGCKLPHQILHRIVDWGASADPSANTTGQSQQLLNAHATGMARLSQPGWSLPTMSIMLPEEEEDAGGLLIAQATVA